MSKFILVFLSLFVPFAAFSQRDSTAASRQRVLGVQYDAPEAPRGDAKKLPFLSGFSISGNLAGAFLTFVSSYGELEGAVRANIRGTYFPIAEVGLGVSDHTDDATDLHYKTNSPFFRLGLDYNILKDKTSGNRLFAGGRLGYTTFKYDISGPDLVDPVWNTAVPYNFKGLSGNQLWIELVFGVETKIWKIFHLGWTARYKNRISKSFDATGDAWYVPGFGKNGTTVISGTFNLIFDI